MPNKLRKAIGAVKDQTSISLAKVANNNASNLEVAILKATTHDDIPIDDRYVTEILQMISSSKAYAAICAQTISKRIGRTKNWIVALKSLMLVLRIFQDGDPHFPKEVLHAMKRGAKILNLTNFRDDSNCSPWDYTAFVRTFALYLDDRLDCFLTGKLQRRFTYQRHNKHSRNGWSNEKVIREMKPVVLLDRICYWQRLLDRAIGTKPTGAAKTNRLVQNCLYAIVRESFDLYRDISDALALLLDSFFHLQHQSCLSAFQFCVRASKQFEELSSFYDLCKTIGVGRTSEYPSVQKVSDELVETLQEFLKDKANFPAIGRSPSLHLIQQHSATNASSKHQGGSSSLEQSPERCSDDGEFQDDSRSVSLDDLMSITESGTTMGSLNLEQDLFSSIDTISNYSLPSDRGSNVALDLLFFEDWLQEEDQKTEYRKPDTSEGYNLITHNVDISCWEHDFDSQRNQGTSTALDLVSFNEQQNYQDPNGVDSGGLELVLVEAAAQAGQNSQQNLAITNDFCDKTAMHPAPQRQYNPFLDDDNDISAITTTTNDQIVTSPDFFPITPPMFEISPTFSTVAPTFSTQKPDETTTMGFQEDDPFAPWPAVKVNKHVGNGSADQHSVLFEQQLWLQNQNKIIAKYMA